MSTLAESPAPTLFHDLIPGRTRYEDRLGWPVTIEATSGRLVVAVGDVLDAMRMPTGRGHLVLAELRIAMLTGPVVAGSDDVCTFLTEPANSPCPHLPAELRSAAVQPVPRGDQTPVPLWIAGKGWIQPPDPDHPLPPWWAVVGAARRVVEQRARAES